MGKMVSERRANKIGQITRCPTGYSFRLWNISGVLGHERETVHTWLRDWFSPQLHGCRIIRRQTRKLSGRLVMIGRIESDRRADCGPSGIDHHPPSLPPSVLTCHRPNALEMRVVEKWSVYIHVISCYPAMLRNPQRHDVSFGLTLTIIML